MLFIEQNNTSRIKAVMPFVLIKVTEFNENKFSRIRRLIEQ
ncbi:hypothetical protein CPS_3200 [Colwellia psychrerythraea 34H]|uniref:Uncharacterized protein n=1 Tax=Colwellia psychrerythraea (strain 34H / ATCC BAA-681) TaxID=167879 RepID=Q47Z74_COLP3|nr:hypothetical protein CPS_3200 [Colwellia psychrerythraea 34H]